MVKNKQIKNPLVYTAGVCAVLLYSGMFKIHSRRTFLSVIPVNQIVFLEGVIVSNPLKYSLQENNYTVVFSPRIVVARNGSYSYSSGAVTIYLPANFVESHFPGKLYTDLPYEHSSLPVLADAGAKLRLTAYYSESRKAFFAVDVSALGWEKNFWGRIGQCRALGRLQFRRLMYAWGDAGGLILALLSGSEEYIEDSVAVAFRNAGLSYILALSGMHLALFYGIVFFIAGRFGSKKKSYLFSFIAVCFFLWFAGISPSLFRAFLCISLLLVATVFGLSTISNISVLSLSFLLQALLFPEHLNQKAFILSYAALAGIITVGEYLEQALCVIMPARIATDFSTATGAQLFTAPFSILFFGNLTPIGIPASVIVGPLVALFLRAALLFIFMSLCIPSTAAFSGFIMMKLYSIIKHSVFFFACIPRFTIKIL
jgi:competence protein ComEC